MIVVLFHGYSLSRDMYPPYASPAMPDAAFMEAYLETKGTVRAAYLSERDRDVATCSDQSKLRNHGANMIVHSTIRRSAARKYHPRLAMRVYLAANQNAGTSLRMLSTQSTQRNKTRVIQSLSDRNGQSLYQLKYVHYSCGPGGLKPLCPVLELLFRLSIIPRVPEMSNFSPWVGFGVPCALRLTPGPGASAGAERRFRFTKDRTGLR